MRIPKFIFIKLEKESHRPVLSEGSRSPPARSSSRRVGTPSAPMARHCGYSPKTLISGEGRSSCTLLAAFFLHLFKARKWPILGLFFPKNIKREDCACFHMNVMICSWARHSTLRLDFSATATCFSFCFANPLNRSRCLCVHSDMTDVPLCNVQSIFRSRTFPTLLHLFHSMGGNYITFYLKSGCGQEIAPFLALPPNKQILYPCSIIMHNLQPLPLLFVYTYKWISWHGTCFQLE